MPLSLLQVIRPLSFNYSPVTKCPIPQLNLCCSITPKVDWVTTLCTRWTTPSVTIVKPPSHIHVFNRWQMTVIKPSPTFLTSTLSLILLPSTFSYLPSLCPCHRNFGNVQNFRLVIENHFWPPHTEVKPNLVVWFQKLRSSLSVNFRLENIYHIHRKKHKFESRFLGETADLLGLNGSTVGDGRRLYSTVQGQ